jgi:hypothetical protein
VLLPVISTYRVVIERIAMAVCASQTSPQMNIFIMQPTSPHHRLSFNIGVTIVAGVVIGLSNHVEINLAIPTKSSLFVSYPGKLASSVR